MNPTLNSSIISASFCLFITMLLVSCGEIINSDDYNIKQIEVSPSEALPLAYGSLSIEDFLSKEDTANIKIDNNDVVYYLYEKTLITQEIKGLFALPDLNASKKTIPLPNGTIPANANEIVYGTPLDEDLDFNFDKEKLSEILFKQGSINLLINFNNPNPNIELEVSLPNFKLDNVPFKKRVINGSVTFPLEGYIATLNNNKFHLTLSVIIKAHPNSSIIIPSGSQVETNISFTNMDFKYIKGFFGEQAVNNLPDQTLDLNVFNTSFQGRNVSNAKPVILFTITNDYGVPITLDFNPIQGRKSGGAFINMGLSKNPVTIDKPTQLGLSSITDLSITNAPEIVDFLPTKIYYKVGAIINKGITSGDPGSNFCADTSKLRVKLHVEIPLFGRASNIILADTIDLDLSDLKTSEVESFFLKIKTTNQLPIDATLQLYLADDQAKIIDSLFLPDQTKIIKGSKVNNLGELESATLSESQIDVPKYKTDNVFKAKKLIINAAINTIKNSDNTQPNVKFKSKYKMDLIIGLNAQLKLKIDL